MNYQTASFSFPNASMAKLSYYSILPTICISLGYCNLAQILILCDNRLLKVHTENTANKQIRTKGFSEANKYLYSMITLTKVRS